MGVSFRAVLPWLLPLLLSQACSPAYVPTEYPLREGVIPSIDVAGEVAFLNAQPSTEPTTVYSYIGSSLRSDYHAITEVMVNQAAHEIRKNGRVRPGSHKTIALKVLSLQSHYIAFFWKSSIEFTADLGNGKSIRKDVKHASGNVVQDLNGCIAEGVIFLLNDETVRAYLAE